MAELGRVGSFLVWITDPAGEVIYLNEAWESLTGRPADGLRGRRWLDVLDAADRDSAKQIFASALAAEQPFKLECRLKTAEGARKVFALSAIPQMQGGVFVGYLGTGIDVSFRSRQQEALKESDARFRELAQNIGGLYCSLSLDRSVLFWNTDCEEVSGIPASEALGRKAEDLLRLRRPHEFISAVNEVLRTKTRTTIEVDLGIGEAETPLEISLFPTPEGISLLGRLTEGERGGDSGLRSSEGVYRSIFENANDAILILEPRTEKILEANARALELYGFPREEFIGMSLKRVTMDIPRGEREIRRALDVGAISNYETVHFRRDGAPMTLVVNASVIDYKGSIALLGICRDLSHVLNAGDAANSQDNLLQRLLASSEDLVSMQDKEGRYLFYSGSPRFGLTPERVRGKTPHDLFPPEVAHRILSRLSQVVATGMSLSAETQIEWQGETLWYLDQISPVRNEGGGVVYTVTISRNITERKKREEQLRRSEERYRTFIQQSTDGIWRIELLSPVSVSLPPAEQVRLILEFGYLAECNDVMARDLGYARPESVVGTPLASVVPRERDESIDLLLRFVEEQYQVPETEQRVVGGDGSVRYYATTYTGIVEEGNLVRIWGSRRDITERTQADRRIRLLAQTIASAKDCISITDLDERILFVNQAFLAAHGYTEEELLGKPFSLVRSPAMAGELARLILPSTLHGGWYGEVIHRRRDGSDLPLELWISVVRNDEGDPVALVGVARDITERKRMEQALQQSESRLRRIADAIRDVVVQTGADGVVEYVSPSCTAMLGYQPAELVGRGVLEHVDPEDHERVEKLLAAALAAGSGIQIELRYRHAGGETLWLEAVGNLLRDRRQKVVGAVFALRDIGSRKRAEGRLRAIVREKEVMLKEIHHRVKNNLQVVSSLLNLQAEHVTDPRIQRALGDSQNRIRSMAMIHQRLYRSPQLAEINFGGYVEELSSQLAVSYGAMSRGIRIDVNAEGIPLDLDTAIPCGIILNELLSNALTHAYPGTTGGVVTVRVRLLEGDLRIEVEDRGVGIPGGFEIGVAESLGLRLVGMLAEQISATLSCGPPPDADGNGAGTLWVIRIPLTSRGVVIKHETVTRSPEGDN